MERLSGGQLAKSAKVNLETRHTRMVFKRTRCSDLRFCQPGSAGRREHGRGHGRPPRSRPGRFSLEGVHSMGGGFHAPMMRIIIF